MARWLFREFRDYPATMTICALWIFIYVAMLLTQYTQGPPPTFRAWVLGTRGGDQFGDMTLQYLAQGQVWRTLTSTFVHYGLVHLAMNLFGMYQLGSLIEEWYGPWQTLALYVLIGTGGNALSALARYETGSHPAVHSGGGSTVLIGFVALCAVVGWRARTRIGDFLRGQMVAILIYTALLGLVLPLFNYLVRVPSIDNWGHACGAIVGGIFGFAHRWLERHAKSAFARWAGGAAVVLLLTATIAQGHEARVQRARERVAQRQQTLRSLSVVEALYRQDFRVAMLSRAPVRRGIRFAAEIGTSTAPTPGNEAPRNTRIVPKQERGVIPTALFYLESTRRELANGPTKDDFERVRGVLNQALTEPPSDATLKDFTTHFKPLALRALRTFNEANKDYIALAPPRNRVRPLPKK